FSPQPAATAVLASGLAALVASALLSRMLLRSEAWDARGAQGILREIAPLATWSTGGAAIHWTFSQGYTYLVAAMLDVRTVAAIAATRLLAMPVNLLSSGIGSLLLPLASRWLVERGAPLVLRRLVWLALGIAATAICYFTVVWLLRDWVFDVMLKKNFAQRDLLLMMWSAAFVLMVVHQQLLYLLIARERFRLLTPLALISAVVALVCSLWGMQHYGGAGAVMGIVLGELTNTIGVVILCLREIGITPPEPVPASAPAPARSAAVSS
ncbi:MAG TPA: polysaccharide biosynthesis C-terminal domain-containing protein, partial [Steroidobacteraceae bacterium]|nr:polysaccharide biosynthesis C-terminal domain-containing protein [Steroidobacteraceae bacterium]